MAKKAKLILIVDWAVVTSQISPYNAPELGKTCLRGNVYGHPKFKRGASITTSTILAFDAKNRTVRTKNSEYRLGLISNDFKAWMKENNYTLQSYNTRR